ncbi:hypothetical protein Clacol_007507 [Clathrus columnatus]|uniref:Uncharacterized protein n=1 Tax=Clathrus columnatus TaxID=1419009 RepID=A0AAV5AJY6_9AGAM|nr:hypothetical protein Clacol_007507 [Clathrus columnatus]
MSSSHLLVKEEGLFQDAENSSSSAFMSQPTSLESLKSPFGRPVGIPESTVGNVPLQKKKKKKKTKKSKSLKEDKADAKMFEPEKPPVLCISRNKHWRYISSYHVRGPWLQLPIELLESLLVLNSNPNTFSIPEHRPPTPLLQFHGNAGPQSSSLTLRRQRETLLEHTTSISTATNSLIPTSSSITNKPTPPPIDPGVFRSVATIRRLIDEASDLAVRAASGLSSATLNNLRAAGPGLYGYSGGSWGGGHSINPLGEQVGNGRNTAMSAMRIHRLRALAVQRLAAAYKTDEIAASVMVMQGASALDDIAERVLRSDPTDPDARYVNFFHEKIPSRQLAESTTTAVLDELIAMNPQRLEYYRTRGIVHCFRDEYTFAIRDFTHVLKEARNTRKAKHVHALALSPEHTDTNIRARKGKRAKPHGQAPVNGTSVAEENHGLQQSPSPDNPDPVEHQALFLRAAAYLQNAVYLIESAILELEEVGRITSDGTELRLCYLENGKYGGVEIGNSDGPLGSYNGVKVQAYRQILNDFTFRKQVETLLRKSIRDHERFLTHFDTLEPSVPILTGDLAQRTKAAFLLTESLRPGSHSQPPPLNAPPIFATYHPLLVESHFSILLATLLLGDFVNLLPTFIRTATLVDGLEGYPVFLPARSMAQAEFIEILERLASGWKTGIQPHSYSSASMAVILRGTAETEESKDDDKVSIDADDNQTVEVQSSQSKENVLDEDDDDQILKNLDGARILLAPVVQRQRERLEKSTADKLSAGDKKRPVSINIPLHGPRVEIVLAYLAAVHLPDMEMAGKE